MKALVNNKYGTAEVLQIMKAAMPIPNDNEVLIENYASSVNSYDWDLIRGKPKIYRLFMGLFKPKYPIPGADVAGRVVAVGDKVLQINIGDRVFGDLSNHGFGGFAQFVCAPESSLALIPDELTYLQAGAIPHSGVLALQAVRQLKNPQRNHKVLVNGAGGCVGTLIIQMLNKLGCEVTAVDSYDKLDLLRSLGANFVIDYKAEDFTKNGKQYDLIIDLIAVRSVFSYYRNLKPHGVLTVVGGKPRVLIGIGLVGSLISLFSGKKIGLLIHQPKVTDFQLLASSISKGDLATIVDHVCELKLVPEAIQKLGEGKLKGKVVVNIEHQTQ